jgi:hypothetical protein
MVTLLRVSADGSSLRYRFRDEKEAAEFIDNPSRAESSFWFIIESGGKILSYFNAPGGYGWEPVEVAAR